MNTFLLICLLSFSAADTDLMVIGGKDIPDPVVFATEELFRYVSAATELPVAIREDDHLSSVFAIYLGNVQTALDDIQFPVSKDEEAYRIYTPVSGGRIFSANSPRALLYAVYDFLETSLGYRWYFPYPEDNIQPVVSEEKLESILQSKEDRETAPAFSFRSREFRDVSPMNASTDDLSVQQIDWWAKLRMNCFLINFGYVKDKGLWDRWKQRLIPEIKKRGMLIGLGEHGSYPLFLPPSRYAKDHPEWYCEVDGKRIPNMHTKSGGWAQFCTTNAEAVDTYIKNFTEFVLDNPEIDLYYPAPNDVGQWCECPHCRDIPIADRYLMLNNKLAEAINQVKPGTRIIHLAYSNHRLPPENTLPNNMVDVDVACWGRDFSYDLCNPNTMPDNAEYLDVFRQWKSLCTNSSSRLLYHWKIMRHYWLGLHLLPLPILDDDFTCIQDLGISGFDLPLGYVGIWTKALNTYVVANKICNPELKRNVLVQCFMTDYYGAYAEDAMKIYGRVDKAYADRRYGKSVTLAWFPDTSRVRDKPVNGLGENARNAIVFLDEAITLLDGLADVPSSLQERFQKLSVVVRHAHKEQECLVALDGLMHTCQQLKKQDNKENRNAAEEAWEATKVRVDELASMYTIENDNAGLYWDGASHRQLYDALEEWRAVVEPVTWHTIGQWDTKDFADSTSPITKRIDVTKMLAGYPSDRVLVRFKYVGGELGATLRRVTLLQSGSNDSMTMIDEDRHGGFAGYVHENATYILQNKDGFTEDKQFFVEVELAAYTTSGSVAQRGCKGDILLGLPKITK